MTSKQFKKLQINLSADYDEDVIDKIHQLNSLTVDRNKKIIIEQIQQIENDKNLNDEDKYTLIGFLSDDLDMDQDAQKLLSEMQIIALFKSIEISIKNMMRYSTLFTKEQINNSYKIKELIKNTIIKIKKLAKYSAYDELRLINNCIKHSGKVSKELSRYPNWIKDTELKKLNEAYERLKPDVREFINNFRDEIIKKL